MMFTQVERMEGGKDGGREGGRGGRGLFVLFLTMNRSSKCLQKQNPFHSLFRRKNNHTKHIFVNEKPLPLHAHLGRLDIINLMKWTPLPFLAYYEWPKQHNGKTCRWHINTLAHCEVGATPTKAAEHVRLHFRVLCYDYNRLPISWV